MSSLPVFALGSDTSKSPFAKSSRHRSCPRHRPAGIAVGTAFSVGAVRAVFGLPDSGFVACVFDVEFVFGPGASV